MKFLLLAIMGSSLLVGCGEPWSPDKMTQSQLEIQTLFKSDAEPKVTDAAWTGKDEFKIAMNPEEPNRDKLAQHVCNALYDGGFGGRGVRVDVVDAVQLANNGEWVTIGGTWCR